MSQITQIVVKVYWALSDGLRGKITNGDELTHVTKKQFYII